MKLREQGVPTLQYQCLSHGVTFGFGGYIS